MAKVTLENFYSNLIAQHEEREMRYGLNERKLGNANKFPHKFRSVLHCLPRRELVLHCHYPPNITSCTVFDVWNVSY